jgi:hypothetical protein
MTRKTRERQVVRRKMMILKKLVQARNLAIKVSPKKFYYTRIVPGRS